MEFFKKGDFIEHPKKEWGYGLVLENQQGNILKVNFPNVGIKTISLEHVKVTLAECPDNFQVKIADSAIMSRIYYSEPFGDIYHDLKQKLNDHVVIIENGYFYEVLYKDADLMSKLYGWTVFERSEGQPITGFINQMTYIFSDLKDKNISYVLVSQITHKTTDKIERKVSEIFHGSQD